MNGEKKRQSTSRPHGNIQLLTPSFSPALDYVPPWSMSGAILYQDVCQTITVLDLPRSIELGQEASGCLASTATPIQPYASNEPRGYRREELLLAVPQSERVYHRCVQETVQTALNRAQSYLGSRDWCLPRHQQALPVPGPDLNTHCAEGRPPPTGPPLLLSPLENVLPDVDSLGGTVTYNTTARTVFLVATHHSFLVPPRSVFLCSRVDAGMPAFLTAMSSSPVLGKDIPKAGFFDLVLMDPPWANRSVRHSKTYVTAESQVENPFDQILPILRDHLVPEGIAAVWVTNKEALRKRILQSMANIGFEMFEEWIWVKVTAKGQPVTDLDGIWRKPYEILLVFARNRRPPSQHNRRVLIAVPDVHSRKPCLKEMIEPFLPKPYQALELFARSLTAGWWSFGDEVLKFQHRSHWIP